MKKSLTTKTHERGHDILFLWFEVTTELGKFIIGWRKRVIKIDWSGISGVNGRKLFKEENVTKDTFYIHAWGNDKAIEYLKKIRESFHKA